MNENKRVRDEYVAHVRTGKRKARAVVRDIGGNGLPNELLCPITHKAMVDPVMTAYGHTPRLNVCVGVRSPVTGLVLSSRSLTPNVVVRSMC